MITANVIHRTFHIALGNSTGTACAIDREGRQYLVTARHVVKGIRHRGEIRVSFKQKSRPVDVEVVGIGEGDVDVAVLACSAKLAPPLPLEASNEGLAYGQTVFFLGFPFGWNGGLEGMNRGFPMPFVKGGIVSTINSHKDSPLFYLDGYGNRGFSGGPVIFVPGGEQASKTTPFQLAGIVVNYPTPLRSRRPILDKNDNRLNAYFIENPGLVAAVDILSVTEIIDSNPIGFELPTNQTIQ